MKIIFCYKCHKRIIPPPFLEKVNAGGKVKLKCGDPKCGGSINFKK